MKRLLPLVFALVLGGEMLAQDSYEHVQIGDLYYNLDAKRQTAVVTYDNLTNNYPDLTIAVVPSTVTYSSVTYTVTEVGYMAFYNSSALTSVTIRDNVTFLAPNSFGKCANLKDVVIPNSVTVIGLYAFSECTALTSIDLPTSLTTIGGYAFHKCSKLKRMTIPDGVTTIGNNAFADCNDLASITLPQSVTEIGDMAFMSCTSLTSVVLPEGLTAISSQLFLRCSSLVSVTIPNSVTEIAVYAFGDCTALTSVTIPNAVEYILLGTFDGCTSLQGITIPSSVVFIGNYAFSNCISLASITCEAVTPPTCSGEEVFKNVGTAIPVYVPLESVEAYKAADGWKNFVNIQAMPPTQIGHLYYDLNATKKTAVVTAPNRMYPYWNTIITDAIIPSEVEYEGVTYRVNSIGDYAFMGCSELARLTIPTSVKSIGVSAFFGCTGLKEMTIPSSVRSIGDYAIAGCSGLTGMTCEAVTPPSCGEMVFYSVSTDIPLSVPFGSIEAYKETAPWRDFTNIRALPPTKIGDLYYHLDETKRVAEVTIETSASSDYEELRTIEIPATVEHESVVYDVKSIGESAFSSCSGLAYVTIPSSIEKIGDRAFYGCTGMRSMTCEAQTPPACGKTVFYGISSVTPVYVPTESVDAYKEAEGWKDLRIQALFENHVQIGDLYYNLDVTRKTAEVTFDKDILNWDNTNYLGVTDVVIPATVEYNYATYEVTSIGDRAFAWCSTLTSVVIPEGVVSIGDYGFNYCSNLTSVGFPNSVRSIGLHVFSYCNALTEPLYNDYIFAKMPQSYEGDYTIPEGIEVIGNGAFYTCHGVTSVRIPSSVTLIGEDAFYYCSMTSLTCEALAPPTCVGKEVFWGVDKAIPLYVPEESVEDYQTAETWKDFTNIGVVSGVEDVVVVAGDKVRKVLREGRIEVVTPDGERYDLLGRKMR